MTTTAVSFNHSTQEQYRQERQGKTRKTGLKLQYERGYCPLGLYSISILSCFITTYFEIKHIFNFMKINKKKVAYGTGCTKYELYLLNDQVKLKRKFPRFRQQVTIILGHIVAYS